MKNNPTNHIMVLDDLIYAGAKLVCEKNQGPLDGLRQKIKTQVGTQTNITNKKTTAPSKNTEH